VAAGGLDFAGFRLGVELDTRRSGYPRSRHEFWATPSGVIVTPGESLARFRGLLGRPGWSEEVVFHWPIVWEDAGGTLTWDCGEYAIVARPR
jgi:hypothetical protein